MTETLITLSTRAAGERRPGVVGTPLPALTRIADAADGIGELQLKGHAHSTATRPRDATAASVHADGWFRTGDIARSTRTARTGSSGGPPPT